MENGGKRGERGLEGNMDGTRVPVGGLVGKRKGEWEKQRERGKMKGREKGEREKHLQKSCAYFVSLCVTPD